MSVRYNISRPLPLRRTSGIFSLLSLIVVAAKGTAMHQRLNVFLLSGAVRPGTGGATRLARISDALDAHH